MLVYAAAGNGPWAGRDGRREPIRRVSRRLRHLSNKSTIVTATGMYSGDSVIRKRTIGKSIGFLAFSAKRNRRFCCVGELVGEFVGKNLWATGQQNDVAERPTLRGVLSPGDKAACAVRGRAGKRSRALNLRRHGHPWARGEPRHESLQMRPVDDPIGRRAGPEPAD